MKNYKFLITVLLILFCASIVATLISCSNTDIIVPPMKQEITNISFKDKTFAYDGKEHSLTIEGTLPAGVNVTYENNNQINVGEYEVTATFIDITGNYEVPEPMTATLTIYNDGSYYSVVFNYEDKQLSYLVKDGELFTDVPQIPSKIGYEGKWDYDFNNPITSDLEVNIKYELIEYNINYILPEGVNNNEKNPSTYNYVSPRIELYSLKDEFGSYFDGWYTTKTFEPESKINYIPTNSTGDITLYAKFINYKIESAAGFEFNYTDYEYPALTMTVNNTQSTIALSRPIEVSEGCSWILSKDIEGLQKIPTKNMSLDIGHNLAYITVWYDDEHNLVYILDIYKLDMFDYKFINENETYVDTTTIQEQTYIDEPTSPIKKGYTFIGWSTDDKGNNIVNFPYQINKNEIFYANYKLNTYKLTYNLNGGSIEGELTQKIPFGSKYELETPTRKGYTFKGYTYNNEPIESGIYVYDTDITIEAQWEANSYNISYYINGKLLYKDSATYDSTYTIKDTIYNYYCKEWVYLDNIIYYPDQEFIFNYDKDISLNGYVVEYSGNDFGCSIINNNTAVKINNYTGNILDLIIPNYIKINNISYRVTSIGSWAFDNCSSLTSITIPEGVTSIGDYAFWGCTSLENVYYNGTIEQWLNIEFNDEDSNPMYYAKHFYMLNDNDEYEEVTNIKIPNTITVIPNYAFCGFDITSIEIPEGVTSIGDYAFDNCSNLTSISISSRVTSIGDYAFEDCDNLKAVYISDITSWLSIDFYNFKSNPLYYAQNLYLNGELVRNLVIPEGVTSIGDHTFENCSSLRSITLSEGVTSIGDYAFENCSSLTSITLPSTLASIGNHTFENCSSLENVYYNGTIEEWLNIEFNSEYSNPMRSGYNFYMLNENNEYEKVISIKIPNTITVIPNYAFCGFYNITSIEIPEGVTSIGDYAFSNCSNLTSITLPEGVTSIGDYAFSNCSNLRNITLPEGVTSIGKYAFYDCMWLSSITLPKSITSIGTLAFLNDIYLRNVYYNGTIEEWLNIEFERYDSNPMYYAKHFYMLNDNDEYEEVTNIKIPNTITVIPNYAFCGFDITSIEILGGVTSIGSSAFRYCRSLTSITLPSTLASIGDHTFEDCSSLENVYYNGTIEQWLNIEFNDEDSNPMYYAKDFYMLNDNDEYEEPTSIVIPSTVTSIPSHAFYNFASLESITLPEGVTSIGDHTFENCSSLRSITLPEGVTSIGDYAFRHCYSLTSIIIPEAVTSIGDYAFYNCRSLTSITLPSTLASIGNHTFENCSSLENVYYNGTIEEWLNIKFERYDSNPMDYAKHFYMLNDNDEYEEVTNIKIPNTITVIPNYTFCGFDITSIEIPEGVTSIGDYAFYNCRSLENVYYNGTIEQWLNIEFGSYNGNPMDYANHLYVLGEDGNYYEATELL